MTTLRSILFVLGSATALAACGTDPVSITGDGGDGSGADGGLQVPTDGFQLKTPDITIGAGAEETWCWYFKAPNVKTLAIKKWASHMTPGSHHMIMYTTSGPNADHPPNGAAVKGGCDQGSVSSLPVWTYSTQMPDQEQPLPVDDGAGKPVGMEIAAGQYGHLEMHYNNKTDLDIVANVTLNAEAYPDGTSYTPTAAYVTYNAGLSIPSPSNDLAISQTCAVPATAKFWTLSTHAHKQAVATEVRDGAPTTGVMKFSSTDWEHPGAAAWNPDFDTFASGQLTYTCTYDNTSGRTITSGNSAVTDEMCMAVGYFFPATKPTICINNFIVTQ